MRVLEVEDCRSLVVRALVATASGPGFKRLIYFHEPEAGEKKSLRVKYIALSLL